MVFVGAYERSPCPNVSPNVLGVNGVLLVSYLGIIEIIECGNETWVRFPSPAPVSQLDPVSFWVSCN